MYRRFYEWNEEGNILAFKVRLPPYNPFSKYRKELNAAQKKELPDTRVLSQDEWTRFSQYLTPRAFAICDLALRRFLRMADIKAINATSVIDGQIRGIQAKTGFEYIVPVAGKLHPKRYDFTNFAEEFRKAKKKAGLDYPTDHPLHFSFKDLRRTGATWAYRKTKDLVGISEMLGHQDTSTTRRYLNIDNTDREAIARAVDEMANGIQQVI
jgi:integrase